MSNGLIARMDKLRKLVFLVVLLQSWLRFSRSLSSEKKNSKSRLCFTVFGDFGGLPKPPYTTWMQRKVGSQMAKVMAKMDCRFIIALGDNFYYSGVQNVKDPRFNQTFERTYNMKFHYVPWYIIAGNHDHLSNVSAQIAYSKVSSRWKFPHYFHAYVHKIPNTGKSVHIILIDTTLLIELCSKSRRKAGPLVSGQLHWIENELKSSKSDYIIVGGHHPVLSAGSHGSNPCLLTKLKPLLEKYGVTAYFSGHDHNLQHIKTPRSTVAYFVSGSGNFYNGWSNNRGRLPRGSLKFFKGDSGGFAIADLCNKNMTLNFYTDDGQPVYTTSVLPRHKRTDLKRIPNAQNTKDLLRNFFSMYQHGRNSYDFWRWFNPAQLRTG